jgi:hypothetical protein
VNSRERLKTHDPRLASLMVRCLPASPGLSVNAPVWRCCLHALLAIAGGAPASPASSEQMPPFSYSTQCVDRRCLWPASSCAPFFCPARAVQAELWGDGSAWRYTHDCPKALSFTKRSSREKRESAGELAQTLAAGRGSVLLPPNPSSLMAPLAPAAAAAPASVLPEAGSDGGQQQQLPKASGSRSGPPAGWLPRLDLAPSGPAQMRPSGGSAGDSSSTGSTSRRYGGTAGLQQWVLGLSPGFPLEPMSRSSSLASAANGPGGTEPAGTQSLPLDSFGSVISLGVGGSAADQSSSDSYEPAQQAQRGNVGTDLERSWEDEAGSVPVWSCIQLCPGARLSPHQIASSELLLGQPQPLVRAGTPLPPIRRGFLAIAPIQVLWRSLPHIGLQLGICLPASLKKDRAKTKQSV